MTIAVLGANGFVAGRLLEVFHLSGQPVRAVVRRFSAMAQPARFSMDMRVADARDVQTLKKAFEGCEAVIHTVTGNEKIIVETIDPVYQAAEECGVKRIVYLSTASVHGQTPKEGTDESTPLSTKQAWSYNNAKVKAERQFQRCRKNGKVELVMLRPGIVFGPRSRWISSLADDLLAERACFIGQREGICNSIYVDNLIHAITLALKAPAAAVDGEVFIVGDAETVTWGELYAGIANALGVDAGKIPVLQTPHYKKSWKERVGWLKSTRSVQAVLPMISPRAKRAAKAALAAWHEPVASHLNGAATAVPNLSQEIAMLHACSWHFTGQKAANKLNYRPVVAFSEGIRRSVGWLKFVGYPVVTSDA